MYRSRGVWVSGSNVYSPAQRDQWREQLASSARTRLDLLYEQLDFLTAQKKRAEASLVREARKYPIMRLLESAPGFGPIRAARLIPIVVTPHRFRTKRQFWSYCGLGIVTRSSSDWIQNSDRTWVKARVAQTRGLSRQHNHGLKSIFKGAATTVIIQLHQDPMHVRYERLLEGGTKPPPASSIPNRNHEQCSNATLCVAAQMSIREFFGQGRIASRPYG